MSGRFGDDEPEDAWDPDDAVDVLITNLARRIALLDGMSGGEQRARLRWRMLHEDMEHVHRRIEEALRRLREIDTSLNYHEPRLG